MSIVRHMALFVIVCYVVIYPYILLVQVLCEGYDNREVQYYCCSL